jgi:hypothetical protein
MRQKPLSHGLTAGDSKARESSQPADNKQLCTLAEIPPYLRSLAAQLQYFYWDTKKAGVRPF